MQLSDADAIRKCVVYVGYRKKGRPAIRGTSFFVTYESAPYLVTVKHNLIAARNSGAKRLLIRYNRKNAGIAEFETDFADWHEHPDPFTDVAVMPVTDHITSNEMDVIPYPAENHVNARVISSMPVTVGDEVFFPGLFSPHAGNDRNVPVIRAGNIAAMAEEPVRIKWFGNTKAFIDAYLVEARSLGGLSGSPVFVHFPWRRRTSTNASGKKVINIVAKATEHCLLGIVHGHYDEQLQIDGRKTRREVNLGMAIVVPFTTVVEFFPQVRGAPQRP